MEKTNIYKNQLMSLVAGSSHSSRFEILCVGTVKSPLIILYSTINLVWVLLDCSEGKFRDDNISVTLKNLEKLLKQNLAPLL